MTTQPDTHERALDREAAQDQDHGRPGLASAGRRTPLAWQLVVAVVAVAGGAGYWSSTRDDVQASVEPTSGPAMTVEVVRDTIADTRSFDGTLGFGEALTVSTPAEGVVTRVAEQGTQVIAGTELFRIDERPVTALLGAIPMYRDLGQDDTGTDAAQLIDNLTELGYADCDAEDTITGCVEAAIEDWQADLGLEETGTVGMPDVVFVPTTGRVDTLHVRVGQGGSPGTPLLDITGADQVVTLEVEVRDRGLLSSGADVMIRLPGGDEVTGTVTAANVVQAEAGDGGIEDAITRVEVTLDTPVDESLVGGPADVEVELGQRVDVLTVPVNALVATGGGDHGLEVVASDGTTSIVPVDTGLFAAGWVEVSGDGIDEGTVVGVAGR